MRIAGINSTELLGGFAAIAIGAFAVWEAARYPIGTLRQMGPGYFPVALGILMMALGGAIVLEGLRADAERLERPAYRSLVFILAGIAAFGFLIDRAGLVPAAMALVVLASLSEPRLRLGFTLILAVAVSGLSVLIFTTLLGLPLSPLAWR